MENFKYSVIIETHVWDYEKSDGENQTNEAISFENENPLESRNSAFNKVDSQLLFFQENDIPGLNTLDLEAALGDEEGDQLQYRIRIELEYKDLILCVFDSVEEENKEDILLDLIDEYNLLKDFGLDLTGYEESISYIDHKDNKTHETKILPNTMDWSNASINLLHNIADLL